MRIVARPTVLILIAPLTLLISCGKSNQPQQPGVSVARCTHAVGLCNLPLFIAAEDQRTSTFEHIRLRIELQPVPDWSKHPLALQKGDVEFSVTPFTNVMTAYAAGAPLRIIAGSGANGLRLVAAKEIKSATDLRDKRIGTFRADTLEMMLFSYLKNNGMTYADVNVIYFSDGFQLISAFTSGKLDAMTHVEPYAQRALGERECHILARGEGPEVWGIDHPDCVLTTTTDALKDTLRAKRMVQAMLQAEATIKKNPEAAARRTARKYFRAPEEDIVLAGKTQIPGVDITKSEAFMRARFEDLKELGHISRDASFEGFLDLRLLKAVLKDQQSGG